MPRKDLLKGRVSQAHQLYHVTFCTEKRKKYFNNIYCGRLVVQQMKILQDEKQVDSIAWVIMPDHLHWLFQLGETQSLSAVVKRLKARSAIKINHFLQRRGSLWQRGFHDHALRKDEDIRQISRYIVANPLRAQLVEHIGDYSLMGCRLVKLKIGE